MLYVTLLWFIRLIMDLLRVDSVILEQFQGIGTIWFSSPSFPDGTMCNCQGLRMTLGKTF